MWLFSPPYGGRSVVRHITIDEQAKLSCKLETEVELPVDVKNLGISILSNLLHWLF
jgi:hypothetical protein